MSDTNKKCPKCQSKLENFDMAKLRDNDKQEKDNRILYRCTNLDCDWQDKL